MVGNPARFVRRVHVFVAVVCMTALMTSGRRSQRWEALLGRSNEEVLLFIIVTSNSSLATHIDGDDLNLWVKMPK